MEQDRQFRYIALEYCCATLQGIIYLIYFVLFQVNFQCINLKQNKYFWCDNLYLDYVEGRYVSPDGDNVLPIDTLSILRQATQGMSEISAIKT